MKSPPLFNISVFKEGMQVKKQQRKHMDWITGKWLNPPLQAQQKGEGLTIMPEMKKDFRIKTLYGFKFEKAPALLAK
ncbi:hypothetical protein [Paenibacillus sp. FSL H7-0331]|uniref:hypothetical protein n=1 Tax=Paenibacillus sp. FSL H7-0331 TaxID=1920421 RepID=UPI0015C388DD|nr:hypothetical protein [Paenibacillus sp. FSL H7-0331]